MTKAKKALRPIEVLEGLFKGFKRYKHKTPGSGGTPVALDQKEVERCREGKTGVPCPQQRVFRVCLTGGPCSGKSSSLNMIKGKLEKLGYKVWTVSEAATIVFSNGADFLSLDDDGKYNLIKQVMKIQMALEDSFTAMALDCDQPSVILCDRGVLDNRVYFPDFVSWQAVLDEEKWDLPSLRKRYDGVVHLVTAAEGAEEYYTLANNEARRENKEEAISLDRGTRNSYIAHPQWYMVPNVKGEGFEGKVDRAHQSILQIIKQRNTMISKTFKISYTGCKSPRHLPDFYESKSNRYVYHNDFYFPTIRMPQGVQYNDIVSTRSFFDDGSEVRRKGENSTFLYSLKKHPKQSFTTDIQAKDYLSYLHHKKIVGYLNKRSRFFVMGNQYYQLIDMNGGQHHLLRTRYFNGDEECPLPDFITGIDGVNVEDVTGQNYFEQDDMMMVASGNSWKNGKYTHHS